MDFRRPAAIASMIAIALGAAACGGTDEDSEPAAGAAETQQSAPAGGQAEPAARIDQLAGERTSVALEPSFLEALESLDITPGAVGDARITEAGAAVFPITGGNVTYYEPGTVSPFVQGRIDHEGSGLSLEAGGTTVELEDFVIDPGTSILTGTVSADGEEVAQDAPLFFVDGRTLEPLETRPDGNAVLEGATVKLRAEAAQLLNDTFGTDALKKGFPVGKAKVTINTK